MKTRLVILLFCASLLSSVCASAKTILPDSCGDDSVKFEVKTKNQTAPAPPPEGKAQIIFVENENQAIGPFMYATVRFGLDGAWVGANYGNSYFAITVDPGVHHVCANWQSTVMGKKIVDMATFTAEAGKVYYFAANVMLTFGGNTGGNFNFSFAPINEEEGKYRVKAWKFATWKTKK